MPALSFARAFFWSQLFVTPPQVHHDFSGQTIIVTGSNSGVGLEAARQFAELGCSKLILAVRTLSKGESAKASILQSTQRDDDSIEVWQLDMCSTASITEFVKRANGLERLDVLVENAGVAALWWDEFEGMEQNIKINVISTCLLAMLMLPKLRKSAEQFATTPRLVVVTSEALKLSQLDASSEGDMYTKMATREYFEAHKTQMYGTSKLMQVLFIRELVKHIDKSVIVTSVTPGLTHSELANRTPYKMERISGRILKALLARKTEVGARTLVAGACVGHEGHGGYMEDCKVTEPDSWLREDEKADIQLKTYQQTIAYLEKLVPGVSKEI